MVWEVKKLGEVCDKASSNISQNQLDNETGEYPIFGAGGLIKNISFFHQDKEYISIVKDGAGIGRINLQPANSSVIGTLQYLIPKKEIDISYLYYFLLGIDFNKHKNGATIPHIYFKDYSQESILVPPLPIQKKIVAILDKSFEQITRAKETAEKNLKNAKEIFESYLQSIFENKGEGWEEKKLGEVCEKITDGSHNPPKGINYSEYLMLSSKNILNDKINYDSPRYLKKEDFEIENKRTQVKEGDVLLTIVGTIGRVAVASKNSNKFTLQRSVAVLKNKKYVLNSRFLMFYLESIFEEMTEKSRGVAQKGLYLNQIQNLFISIPSLSEQQIIVEKLDSLSSETKKLEAIYQQKLKDLEELKKSILQKAFNGELVKE